MIEIMEQMISKISSLAMEGMLFEVSATPKPGLVDRSNCGAHRDMDYFTFMSSAAALHDSFDTFVKLGVTYNKQPIKNLLNPLRIAGIEAENKMFTFTRGINTHKGMIFTLGMLCGCAGWSLGKMPFTFQNLCGLVSEMCAGICEKEFSNLNKKSELTKGERMFLEYGCTGVRGEVEQGYPTVTQIALPIYQKFYEEKNDINDVLVQTLLHLIAKTCDTNIASRHDMDTCIFAQNCAKEVLRLGGIKTVEGKLAIEKMDEVFIKDYISPGGCADLLAVTHFLYQIEHTDLLKYNVVIENLDVERCLWNYR